MEGVGLVAYVERQLERDIALGKLSAGGWGSERKLAGVFGVSRSTVREALRRLGARGMVVQRPGRMARAVSLDASLTLENVGLALHDERSSKSRWLLEGFFSLKRQVLVDLLVDCCAKASDVDLRPLERACFELWTEAQWKSGEYCARLEFELLRMAAQLADRPGHLLLIQSLQWALWGSASRLLPHMSGEEMRPWVVFVMEALESRDSQAIQRTLPELMKACDERVLERFAPVAPVQPSPSDAHVSTLQETAEAPLSLEALNPEVPEAALDDNNASSETAPPRTPTLAAEQDDEAPRVQDSPEGPSDNRNGEPRLTPPTPPGSRTGPPDS
jgi:GntR family transcriptional regulator, transcriptional repressor for pyruvate dehydrogenase complex